jgi:hypothetical protein
MCCFKERRVQILNYLFFVTQNWKVVIMYTGNTSSMIVRGSWIYYCLCNQCLSPLKL